MVMKKHIAADMVAKWHASNPRFNAVYSVSTREALVEQNIATFTDPNLTGTFHYALQNAALRRTEAGERYQSVSIVASPDGRIVGFGHMAMSSAGVHVGTTHVVLDMRCQSGEWVVVSDACISKEVYDIVADSVAGWARH